MDELYTKLDPTVKHECTTDFYTFITDVFNLLPSEKVPEINPGFLKDTIGFFDKRKEEPWNLLDQVWRITTYMLDGDDEKIEISLSLSFMSEKIQHMIHMDRYGNCYCSQEMLLASLPYNTYQIYSGNKIFGVTHTIDTCAFSLENYFTTIKSVLGDKGNELVQKLCRCLLSADNNEEFTKNNETAKLLKMKVVFPFLFLLSDSNLPEIQFNNGVDKILVKIGRRNIDYSYTDDYATFAYFKKFVANSSNICAFQNSSLIYLHRLMDLQKIDDYRKQMDGKKNLEEYKFKMNYKFGHVVQFSIKCHEIAWFFMKDVKIKRRLKLRHFNYVVSWICWKLQRDWNDTAAIEDSLIVSLRTQYYKLFGIVDSYIATGLKLPNSYSATYHFHVHYIGVKQAVTGLTGAPVDLIPPMKEFKNAAAEHLLLNDMRQIGNIENTADSLIKTCMKFYLQTVPFYLFNELLFDFEKESSFYAEVKTSDDGYNYEEYYYSENLYGSVGIFRNNSKTITTYFSPYLDECSEFYNP